ncbi:fasciclin domain-containing protein [uncultured Chitinophaga sp.]|jgi:Fasciclin domain.|uniref:fasciclin domain-containing protein n=1 Tax=uncultured Chitinophaga sp. TaxID=339340 RepID=UPI0026192719|nr:fasciclin domain-containing protein [uncultured Chitinophaga sp.]
MKRLHLIIALVFSILLLNACKKDYYVDGGLANPHYNGSIYDYLASNPYWFDTISYIIDRAGMKEMLQHDTVTFFTPTDDAVKVVMDALNDYRYYNIQDSVHLEDIDPEVWRHFLSMYVLKGKYLAKQFARVDQFNVYAYPGINYVMDGGYVLNIGLIYQNYNNVEAVGPRIIRLTDITYDPQNFQNNPSVVVATSDIQPNNGVLHVLNNNHVFGFRGGTFIRLAQQYLEQ